MSEIKYEIIKKIRRLFQVRAELNGVIVHLYGLTESEFAHILSTFSLVAEEVKSAAMQGFRTSK